MISISDFEQLKKDIRLLENEQVKVNAELNVATTTFDKLKAKLKDEHSLTIEELPKVIEELDTAITLEYNRVKEEVCRIQTELKSLK